MTATLSSRIVDYLTWAKDHEPDVWLADDIAISRLTVALAVQGYKQPHIAASYYILGLHPDKVASAIEARRRAKLGNLYDSFNLPPKKPSVKALPQYAVWPKKVSGS